ncbi:MAG: extracellular solute-binding protein [Lachnospiraceae bacterium]|nr:extracellular solute-binding protein [Lachnospiraceae bacterium]
MRGQFLKKAAAFILIVSMSAPLFASASAGRYESDYRPDISAMVHDAESYSAYIAEHSDAAEPEGEIVIPGDAYLTASEDFEVLDSYDGRAGKSLLTKEEGSVTYEVDVPTAGLYSISLTYFPIKGKNNTIERKVYINGEIPFEGSQYVEFTRTWTNAEQIGRDSRDNDIRPRQEEAPAWTDAFVKDSDGYVTGAYKYYFEQGVNTITLTSVKEPMVIGELVLKQEPELLSYADYDAANRAAGFAEITEDSPVKIQGEAAVLKSDSTLYPIPDRTSSLTEPYNASKTRLNTIGGTNWKLVGQWISWDIDIPEDGLYRIMVKYRQNKNTGVTVCRSLEIDGRTPFAEADEFYFYYENAWQLSVLGNGDSPYWFRFSKGTHRLTFRVNLGAELADILLVASDSVDKLNTAYRELLMIIGSTPDTMRDYQLEIKCPDTLKTLANQLTAIKTLKEMVSEYSKGRKGSETQAIDNLINQLARMTEKPESIAKQWTAFKDNIVSLSSWILTMSEQPLEIDYMLVCGSATGEPKVNPGFFASLFHELKQFGASFVEDYDSIGEIYDDSTEVLDVWILADGTNITSMTGGGRDQATVIKTLVDNYFVPEKGIPVNIKLVNKDVLLSATLAGKGPDVALNVAGIEPMNYALRNAVVDLTQFDDFEEVKKRFYSEAFDQFTLEGGVYALPQTMSFHVMFYRADILDELGLEVPTTWDEFYRCLAVIQKNNMNIGIFPDWTTFAMFLYQHDGQYYTEDSMHSALDTENAIAAFKQWSGNYVNYGMPVSYDMASRFRTGEMPLAIGDYTQYNYLSVFAPEIKGDWAFTLVPGFEREDGTIDHSVSAWETACVIMATSKRQEKGWEFLKWWMSDYTQTEYGNEIENVLGVAGRVATANMNALENLPWATADYRELTRQLSWVKALPQVPGGYFTERHIKNAFYTVYNNNEDPRETLQDYVKQINYEISRKRLEFGLPLE